MKIKPTLPKGTRDFGPVEMAKRKHILNVICATYEQFGFAQIETPAMENLSTLTGKYGEEGDKLLFKILRSGDFTTKAQEDSWQAKDARKLAAQICEKGLHYDLTVPLARYVAMKRHELAFPFKRYQIQPVWRADRPQKGRYQEFYQCDADVLGSKSLLNEVELIQIIDQVFSQLNVPGIMIRINNRKILEALAEIIDASDRLAELTISIDKLDKIGPEKVLEELRKRNFDEKQLANLKNLLFEADELEFKSAICQSEIGKKGFEELEFVLSVLNKIETGCQIRFDKLLARGLDYYTGTILEVECNELKIGSIAAGGRYDDLTGLFGLNDVSGVGFSFGLERIYDLLDHLKLFPENLGYSTQVLFVNFGGAEETYAFEILQEVRKAGVSAEIYPEAAKLNKQMKYADAKGVEFVVMIGSEEREKAEIKIKNMRNGEQNTVPVVEVVQFLSPG